MADHLSKARRSLNMAAIKGKHTAPEMTVRQTLHRLGFRYRLHGAALPGKPDIIFRSRKSVIFVNGCFWHSHSCKKGRRLPSSNESYWEAKRARNAARDARNVASLETSGWRVMTVWECETKNTDALANRLAAFLGETAT